MNVGIACRIGGQAATASDPTTASWTSAIAAGQHRASMDTAGRSSSPSRPRTSAATASIEPTADAATRAAIDAARAGARSRRVPRRRERRGRWQVHAWLKKAVLLYFRTHDNELIEAGYTRFFDKVPLKYAASDAAQLAAGGVRVVPHALVRYGAYVAPGAVLMPCYVNIGAYVGEGTMVDTWATVGSCAQIGRNVHLSGGVGIGGVLEPLQASPTIIEDDCFIGARSEIVEGAVIGAGSVIRWASISAPARAFMIAAPARLCRVQCRRARWSFRALCPPQDGSHSLACAVIVKRVDAQTRAKTSPNELLRDVS